MASENKGIIDIVKKCKILLLDIEGTTTSISFVKDKLFPYAEENVKSFLDSQWDSEDVKEVVSALRKLALEDQKGSVEGVVAIPGEESSKEDQIEGLVNNVKWQMSADRKAGPLKQLQGLIWKQGYDKGDIKGHVYDDVLPALQQWKSTEGHQIYIYSSGSVQAQKLLFGQSQAGDLLPLISGHFDTAVGMKQNVASYTNIVEKIGAKAKDILFLTDIVKEAQAARTAGLHAALVSRSGNAPLSPEDSSSFPVITSLADLTVSNKRKQEPQDVQPAKILKTDTETEVKSDVSETKPEETVKDTETAESAEKIEPESTEKMEVEENGASVDEKVEVEPPKVKESVVIEELEGNEVPDVPMVTDIEPTIIEDQNDGKAKTEEKQTEKMETEIPTVQTDKEKQVVIITAIEEVTEKQLDAAAEIVEDTVPVIEEPATEDMEELKNVGDVLEKECDEILSKVQDVTNLDNITVKLNSIPEETMETDNTDTSDIVEGILDSEQELEMKQTEEAKVTEEPQKVANDEASPVTVESNEKKTTDSEDKPTEVTTENGTETNGVDKAKPETTETKTESEKPETEPQINGSNGTEKVNGEEISSRLDNGAVNGNGEGTNGNGTNGNGVVEEGQGDVAGKEVTGDIKVKSVSNEERNDPLEQTTEA